VKPAAASLVSRLVGTWSDFISTDSLILMSAASLSSLIKGFNGGTLVELIHTGETAKQPVAAESGIGHFDLARAAVE
jgi:hypothetical protein